MHIISAIGELYADRWYFWLQVDKGISPEVVRSSLAERANLPCLAAKTAHKVSELFVVICLSYSFLTSLNNGLLYIHS